MDKIDSFSGDFRFLSNFFPCIVELDGIEYNSVENAYQAAKTLIVSERVPFRTITAGQSKRLGKTITKRDDWNKEKLSVMSKLLVQKFNNPDLRKLLVATDPLDLEEGNTWHDTFWGVCNGIGENHLGKILMQIRNNILTF